jgi:hypothetical protein
MAAIGADDSPRDSNFVNGCFRLVAAMHETAGQRPFDWKWWDAFKVPFGREPAVRGGRPEQSLRAEIGPSPAIKLKPETIRFPSAVLSSHRTAQA